MRHSNKALMTVTSSQTMNEHPSPEPELWTEPKTRFLIIKYKELKDLDGKRVAFGKCYFD